MDRRPREGRATRGRAVPRQLRRRRRRSRPAGHVRVQRRTGCGLGVPARRRRRSPPRGLPGRRDAPGTAASAGGQRRVLARRHRPRVHRPRRHRLQPRHPREGRAEGRRRAGLLHVRDGRHGDRRGHHAVVVGEPSVGIAGGHRGGELRRLPRGAPVSDAPGAGRCRAVGCDPHLAGAGVPAPEPDRLRRVVLGRPRAHHDRRRAAPRAVPGRRGPRRGRGRGGRLRDDRLRELPPAWRRRSRRRTPGRPRPSRRPHRPGRRRRAPRRRAHHLPRVRA